MSKDDKKVLCANLLASLRFAVDDSHVLGIVDSIADEVASDIDGFPHGDYGTDDVKRAVGRVLCRRLGLPC